MAKRLIQLCSNTNYKHPPSRVYAYRILKSLNADYTPSGTMVSNRTEIAMDASRMAALDLKEVAPDKYAKAESLIRDALASIRTNFFHDRQMLGGFMY